MYSSVVEELPLIRSKQRPDGSSGATGPGVGPGSYDVDFKQRTNYSQAPFNSTSGRRPIYDNDPSVPGPGSYDYETGKGESYSKGISAIPFISETPRFGNERYKEGPGPGAYDSHNSWPTKPNPKAHKFTDSPQQNIYPEDSYSGPGYYEPNYDAVSRSNPKVSNFAKYSSRNDLAPRKDVPGPGTYNYPSDGKGRSIYDSKPSSMFATNTKRAPLETSDTPGPGTYNIAPKPRSAPREVFSAFGSSSTRFNTETKDIPGPGAYTGEIAPRRMKPQYGRGTAAFASNSDRFTARNGGPPGPGAYDGSLLPSHVPFGSNPPFQSTVPRFGTVNNRVLPLKFDENVFYDTDPSLYPRESNVLRRPFVNRGIEPTLGPEILPHRSYNINYDGYKPEGSTKGTFGQAPRQEGGSRRQANSAPGPGTYNPKGPSSTHYQNSNWSRDPRYKVAGQPTHGNDIGRTYYESTFITKSHNATIGSDTTWTRNL